MDDRTSRTGGVIEVAENMRQRAYCLRGRIRYLFMSMGLFELLPGLKFYGNDPEQY